MPPVLLLGPQHARPNLATAVAALGIDGPFAAITAGWQEREGETGPLAEHLGREVVDLGLQAKARAAFAEDAELAQAYRARQDELQEAQRLYRLRLVHALAALREVATTPGHGRARRRAFSDAMTGLRLLDRQHQRAVREAYAAFDALWRPLERPALAKRRDAVQEDIQRCRAVLVAGGHVAVLLNRLRLFALDEALWGLPLLAWSAGAMALAERVVLFHDFAPQGFNPPEVLEAGLGLVRGVLPLPDAALRLDLNDRGAMALMARRFQPAACLTLDEGACLQIEEGRLVLAAGSRRLTRRGEVVRA